MLLFNMPLVRYSRKYQDLQLNMANQLLVYVDGDFLSCVVRNIATLY